MNKKIVFTILGGGSGQSNILRGLKKFDIQLNSIVTMADDGGSSGKLREEMNILPPGDLRNCILALSNIEPDMERLFQYRFTQGSLKGQNLGNLFLAAMNDIHGDFKKAISSTSKILAVRGNVCPVTYDDISLCANLKNGNKVEGESKISTEAVKQNTTIDNIFIKPKTVKASQDAINAIKNSDVIIAGPGSLYTSILPVMILDEIREEIKKSKAIKIFITNIMTEHGETDNFSIGDFVSEIDKNIGSSIFDYFLIDDSIVPDDIMYKYLEKQQQKILSTKNDLDILKENNIKLIFKDFLTIKNGLIIHDNRKIADVVKEIFEQNTNIKLDYIDGE